MRGCADRRAREAARGRADRGAREAVRGCADRGVREAVRGARRPRSKGGGEGVRSLVRGSQGDFLNLTVGA